MSKESDQGKLDAEFERLRVVSGRIARDPGTCLRMCRSCSACDPHN